MTMTVVQKANAAQVEQANALYAVSRNHVVKVQEFEA